MKTTDPKYLSFLLRSSFQDFKRNKIRTFLTSLGIMIGVFSVVLLIGLGLGLKNYLEEQFENLGANLILVFPGQGFEGFSGGFSSIIGAVEFDEKDVRSLRRISEADFVVPLFYKSLKITAGEQTVIAAVQGTSEDNFEILNLELMAGEFFTASNVQASSKVGVVGEGLAEELFDTPEDAVGKTVRIDNQRYKIIGVVEKIGDPEQDNSITVPYTATFGSLNPDKTFFNIYLGVESDDLVTSVKEQAEEILLERYDDDEFVVTEQSELLGSIGEIFTILNGVLIAIGSISLIVGGIGIMNIMYSTVTERTKEVGIKRAVGATKHDILYQFLIEAVILSVFGGVLGLLLAALVIAIVHPFFPAALNLLSVILALGISSGIGIFFGVFPATKAARLTPLEAIRYE